VVQIAGFWLLVSGRWLLVAGFLSLVAAHEMAHGFRLKAQGKRQKYG